MAITTQESLKEYILRQLGAPLIQVEVSDEQMSDIIESTIQEYSNFALEGELTKFLKMEISGPCTITMSPEVKSIQKISKGGGISFGGYGGKGFVLDYYSLISGGININDAINSTILLSNQRSLMDKFFGDDLTFTFNENKKKIEVSENFNGPIILEINTEYIPDEIDYIYNHNWIKKMCIARTKLLQSDITGKYDANLMGGARINADRMQQRAEQEIEILREELISKYGGPAPISIG